MCVSAKLVRSRFSKLDMERRIQLRDAAVMGDHNENKLDVAIHRSPPAVSHLKEISELSIRTITRRGECAVCARRSQSHRRVAHWAVMVTVYKNILLNRHQRRNGMNAVCFSIHGSLPPSLPLRPPSLHVTVIAFFPSAADDPFLYGLPPSLPIPPLAPVLPWEGATFHDNDETMQTG